MSLTSSRSRVVDPVLTEHARGWKDQEFVGKVLFPTVNVGVSAGKVIEFGREGFMLYNARRAPGSATRRIEFGYEGKPFALVQDSLDSPVPREFVREAEAVPAIDLGFHATNTVLKVITRSLEVEQAAIALNPANYAVGNKIALSGSSMFSDGLSKPIRTIEDARQAVRKACGLYPNVAVLGPVAYGALKNNESVQARFKNSDLVTNEALAKLLELDQLVEGKAVVADPLTGTFADVWGNAMVLAYVPKQATSFLEPSYGYTYTMEAHPFVETPYYDNPTKSWIYGVTYERAPVHAGMGAGFLIQNVAAPV